MNEIAIILTCVCIHLLAIEVVLVVGLTKIVGTLKESGNKSESENKEGKSK